MSLAKRKLTPRSPLEQHAALLGDLRSTFSALPDSGALDRGGRPYPRTPHRAAASRSSPVDPAGLHHDAKRIAHRNTSETLSALVKADRLDLTIEALVVDES